VWLNTARGTMASGRGIPALEVRAKEKGRRCLRCKLCPQRCWSKNLRPGRDSGLCGRARGFLVLQQRVRFRRNVWMTWHGSGIVEGRSRILGADWGLICLWVKPIRASLVNKTLFVKDQATSKTEAVKRYGSYNVNIALSPNSFDPRGT